MAKGRVTKHREGKTKGLRGKRGAGGKGLYETTHIEGKIEALRGGQLVAKEGFYFCGGKQ